MTDTFNGMRIITNVFLTQDGEPRAVARTWRARLFTRPWRPWIATQIVIPRIPYQGVLQLNDHTLIMHPATLSALRSALQAK